ncbi:hypothetical protein [Streptomyces yokosukanensis]|uniref:hypothetical protein n=1 Tax=Streptomyces yokosukanensis TaxID=67386 RepID=UPI00131A9A6A|nr:hypothetical protein [Streptomyces yokosukanensis]
MDIDSADIVAMREQGDLKAFLLSLAGRTPTAAEQGAAPDKPAYHIPRKGAWPCGTAPSGPTPPPCGKCP